MCMGFVSLQTVPVRASDFTAGSVLEKFTAKELNAYLAGVVHGLAYGRYKKEGKRTNGGMKCILDWYFDDKSAATQIVQAFRKYPDHVPYAVLGAMVEQKCGE